MIEGMTPEGRARNRYKRLTEAAERHTRLAWERGGSTIWLFRAAKLIHAAEDQITTMVLRNTQPYG